MKKKKMHKRFVSFLTASVLIANILPLEDLPNDIFSIPSFSDISVSAKVASDFITGKNVITLHQDFIDYCNLYAANNDFAADHKNDTLVLTFAQENSSVAERLPDSFPGLGNSTYPFDGTIQFNDNGSGYKNLEISKAPFFTHVTASVQIQSDSTKTQSGENAQIKFCIKRVNGSDGSSSLAPLFAQKVYPCNAGYSPADWEIEDSGSTVPYSGVIGEMYTGAAVNLSFEKSSTADIENSAETNNDAGVTVDVGAVCGIMRTGSVLTLNYSETSGDYTIKSENGNAGGIVGTMEGTAALVISKMPGVSSLKTVRSDAANGYAGGLVGKISSLCSITPASGGFTIGETTQSEPYVIPVGGKVIAANAAGGVYGCYTNTMALNEFNVNQFSISAVVYGKYCGGVFGSLENIKGSESDSRVMSISNISSLTATSDTGTDFDDSGYFGGLIGRYTTDGLVNSLVLSNIISSAEAKDSFAAFGGAVGFVGSKAYIKADNVTITAKGTNKRTSADRNSNYAYFGGLVGATSSADGVMIDLGNFTLNAGTGSNAEQYCGGGVVGQFYNGVLRLSGTTDLRNAKPDGTYSDNNTTAKSQSYYGQLVGYNNNVLVYALGSGSDPDPAAFANTVDPAKTVGWRFLRSNGAVSDDLGHWGQVVRLFGSSNAQSADIVRYDDSAHTVTLVAAENSMSTNIDFAKTALNIMLNNKNDGSGYDCLLFDSSSKRSTLLEGSLSLSNDISLVGTGLTGFTRDGSEASDPVEDIGTFIGTLNGNSHGITLAAGETYGVGASGQIEGMGQIYRHKFTGLFAYIGNDTNGKGTISNIGINGNVYVRNAGPDNMSIGGAAARSHGNTDINSVTVNQTVNYYENRNDTNTSAYIGGLIGFADNNSDNGTIELKGTTLIDTVFSFGGKLGDHVYCGGAIGRVSSKKINVYIGNNSGDSVTNTMSTVLASGITAGANIPIGGLVGYIDSVGNRDERKIVIKNTIFGTTGTGAKAYNINNPATGTAGGLLGYAWYNTNTTIDGLTAANASLSIAATDVGLMTYEATGKWKVDSLALNKLTMENGGGNSLGILVNRAFREYTTTTGAAVDGLYLDVLKSGYTLTDYVSSDSTGVDLPESLGVYDEIAAYSTPAGNILSGGAGVISVNTNERTSTDSKITATGSNGTYQNQLTSACSAALTNAKFANQYSRYYYNLDIMAKKAAATTPTVNGGEKLVLWSVHNYAAQNIAGEFADISPLNNSSEAIVDLTGLSFYPIPDAGSTTLKNVNITFDYSGIYTAETDSKNDTDDYTRDPGAIDDNRNQHYLMQSGLFMNQAQVANGDQTITLDGTVTLGGTFLELPDYKGVLISQTMKGSLNTTGSIVLNNLTPKTTENASYADSGYLLVNNIVTDTRTNMKPPVITVKNLSTDGYPSSTTAVAKSLFGTASGTGLTITFDKIKLDARTAALDDTVADRNMTTAYGTSRSIFSQATFFDSIYTDKDASLIYNYTHDEDWGTDTPREVTYGKEVSSSIEYPNKETKYFESQIYTNPTNANIAYNFADTGFLPYVRHAYTAPAANAAQYYREIKVNVQGEEIGRGCGTYNDPYVITSGAQLEAIAKFLFDHKATDISQIYLPTTQKNGVAANASGDRWCSSNHALYTPSADSSKFTSTVTGAGDWMPDNVALYLASAYYQIGDPDASTPVTGISLSSNYVGLGATTDTTESGKDAFRGVIVGAKDSSTSAPTITITNASENPLIKVSNGSVVKNLNIVNTKASIELAQANNSTADASFGYKSNCNYYGGIIGEVMGGDNIIDNSYVTFSSSTVKLTGKSGTIVPAGGYVGVVVYGAVIFKNMTQTVSGSDSLRVNNSGLTVYYGNNTDNLADSTNSAYMSAIYVNPIVGRVINGYAVNETANRFSVTEDGTYHDEAGTARKDKNGNALTQHTLKNGKKHYSIADIYQPSTDADKLSVTAPTNATTGDGTITVPNAQAMFILSLITQSCAGTATTGYGEYTNSLSYGIYGTAADPTVHGMSHNASYDSVGVAGISRTTADYVMAGSDSAAKTAVPYIIRHYTVGGETTVHHDATIKAVELTQDELDGKTLYISVTNGSSVTYFLNKASQNDGTKKGLKADTNSSQATAITLTKQSDGTYTMSESSGKYLGFHTQNNRNFTLSQTPCYLSITPTDDGHWYITMNNYTNSDRYLGLRNSKQFIGQSSTGTYETKLDFNKLFEAYDETKLVYPARCVTSTAGYYNINLTAGVDYTLPDSYRGLGCVGIYDTVTGVTNPFSIKLNTFDGNDCTIDQDIYLNKFYSDNYFNVLHSGTGTTIAFNQDSSENNHGIGLFDSIIMKSGGQFYNFTLKGSVRTAMFSNTYTDSEKEYKGVPESATMLWLSTGGVLGWSRGSQALNYNSITLDNIMVYGANYVAGLLAHSGNNSNSLNVTITECDANAVSLTMSSAQSNDGNPRNSMGAFVGKVKQGKVVVRGTASAKSDVTIKSFSFGNDTQTFYASVGGLVGYSGHGFEAYDMNVSSSDVSGTTIGNANTGICGGIVGVMQPYSSGNEDATAIFRNCTVQNINVQGDMAGGIYGGKWTGSDWVPYRIEMDSCSVMGNSSKNSIIGGGYAGGLVGNGLVFTRKDDTKENANIIIKDCKVSNYNIYANSGKYSGGFVGYCDSRKESITCYIHDSSVENCVIGQSGSVDYAGGAVGGIAKKTDNKIVGYNIKLDNVTSSSDRIGAWVGYMADNDSSTKIRLNGIAIYGTGYEKNIGSWNLQNNQQNTNAAFVFADYTGACESITTPSQVHTSGYNDENNVNSGTPTYPYVNVNPHQSMGTDGTTPEYISSDAAVLYDVDNTKASFAEVTGTAKDTMAAKIYHDLSQEQANPNDENDNYSRRYMTFDNTAISGTKTILDYLNGNSSDDGDRISTYSTERNGLPTGYTGNDFAVVVISNTDDSETTELINRYIQLVTNTSSNTNYAADNEYYDVDISTCKFSNGKFSQDEDLNPGLDRASNQFKLVGGSADGNRKDTFTLLDVQFKDPLDTGKVAYHLYVPVFTRKQINFGFMASAITDTDSVKYPGNNAYQEAASHTAGTNSLHVDGLDSWYTQYVRFTYDPIDLNILIASNSINWNHDKYVLFNTFNASYDKLPLDTYMMLVDPNGYRDKVYYGDLNDFESINTEPGGWKIELNKFKNDNRQVSLKPEQFTSSLASQIKEVETTNGNYTKVENPTSQEQYDISWTDGNGSDHYYKYSESTGNFDLTIPDRFDEVSFNDQIAKHIKAVDPEGGENTGMYKISGAGDAKDVYLINDSGDKVYYTYVPDGTGAVDLKVEEGYVLNEDYYLSMYVPMNNENANDVFFYSINPPDRLEGNFAAVNDVSKTYCCNMIVADLYEQTTSIVVDPGDFQITESNKKLKVTATSTIRLKNTSVASLLTNKELYHGFDIMLDRYEEDGSILSRIAETSLPNDNITATYKINGVDNGDCDLVRNENDLMFRSGEDKNILDDLTNSSDHSLTISATIEMNFADIVAAFPEKTTTNPRIGTNVSATSNLSYDNSENSLSGSSISAPLPENDNFYYREALSATRLTYEAKDELDAFDSYGESSKNYSRLGVNGEQRKGSSRRTYMPINSEALFNAASIEDYDYNLTQKVRFTLRLYKKTDAKENGSVTSADYGNALTIANYLDPDSIYFKIGNTDLIKNDGKSSEKAYVYETPVLSALPEDKRFLASVSYAVKTGYGFYEYANYKVELQAELLDSGGNTIGNKPSDYIVYTNAKVYPTLIENIGGSG